MKDLILIRHASAEDPGIALKDFDRELNVSGYKQAAMIGKYLNSKIKPEVILSSTARRAIATAELVADQLNVASEKIIQIEDLYEASVRTLMRVINEVDERFNSICVIGHNPAVTYLGEYLSKSIIGSVAPGGVVYLQLGIGSWKDISEGCAIFKGYTDSESLADN